ncbi:MAG TPA: hypothetical protein VFX13_18695 [Gaiellales bacterium]|jgi:hypothetical protein|nr:hypothetical protein [Gaiellales bacterium]
MRVLTAVAAMAALLAAVSCEGHPAASTPKACSGLRRPGVPLAFAPERAPSPARARCIGAQYAAVVGQLGWGRLPRLMRRGSAGLLAWQQRSLLYACNGCGLAGFGLDWVRAHRPNWIMHSATGTEIHPLEHPGWVLLNFTDPKYDAAWGVHVRKSLAAGGWTGVEVIDASNDPDWSEVPVYPSTGEPMTERQRRQKLAAALALVRATVKLGGGYSLLADNGPPSVVDFHQINSTDVVTVGEGFARVAGAAWNTVFHYFQKASGWESGVYVRDDPGLNREQAVYGLASFMLVAIPRGSAYVGAAAASSPIYQISPGAVPTTPATKDGDVWVRRYPNGVVAVNPSDIGGSVSMGSAGRVTIPPRSAAIEAGGHLLTSR